MGDKLRYLLLQVRNREDPMRRQEVDCFARTLGCAPARIAVQDLLSGVPTRRQLDAVDVVLLGGSGDYSVAEGGTWFEVAMDSMRELHALAKPTFASCWGFQAMARAMGGVVVTDIARAELGTLPVHVTQAGRQDPVFRFLDSPFLAQMGHQDIVDRLPDDALRLAHTERVENQAFRFVGKPIWCTQFHPELNRRALLERVKAYPQYIERIAGITLEQFAAHSRDTPQAASLLRRFVDHVFGDV
jgi:GMP synthase (glutamine-hydrolysing)